MNEQWEADDALQETIASIPTMFRWARLRAPQLRTWVHPPRVIEFVRQEVWRGERPLSIVLTGPPGCGKTSLGAALLRKLVYQTRRPGFFSDSMALALATRRWKLGDGRPPIVDRAIGASVLLLDELGAEPHAADCGVEEVLRQRHQWMRPTIFTTPFSEAVIKERYGVGLHRRVYEKALVVEMGGAR